jgi:hypothetical protein
MPCGPGLLARPRGQANLPVFAPQRLKQAGGGSEPRIERLVNAMFLEDVGWDEPTIGEWAYRILIPCFALQ